MNIIQTMAKTPSYQSSSLLRMSAEVDHIASDCGIKLSCQYAATESLYSLDTMGSIALDIFKFG